jgi:hypothetical protein
MKFMRITRALSGIDENLAFKQKMCRVCVVQVTTQPFSADIFGIWAYHGFFTPPLDGSCLH